ncbi:unnamed protein product [Meloidogyne enterolobii]|uniref:Uncharacterized protein n=1 Tax=Meloidogyne enterolobii TaxID=390850 RepID=A0ACB0XRN7_MELEN
MQLKALCPLPCQSPILFNNLKRVTLYHLKKEVLSKMIKKILTIFKTLQRRRLQF